MNILYLGKSDYWIKGCRSTGDHQYRSISVIIGYVIIRNVIAIVISIAFTWIKCSSKIVISRCLIKYFNLILSNLIWRTIYNRVRFRWIAKISNGYIDGHSSVWVNNRIKICFYINFMVKGILENLRISQKCQEIRSNSIRFSIIGIGSVTLFKICFTWI